MLPDTLHAVLVEVATMKESDYYHLRLAAITADGILKHHGAMDLAHISHGILKVADFMKPYRKDPRIGFLCKQLEIWSRRLRGYKSNPIYPQDWEHDNKRLLIDALARAAYFIKNCYGPMSQVAQYIKDGAKQWNADQLSDWGKMGLLEAVLQDLSTVNKYMTPASREAKQTIWRAYMELYRKMKPSYKPMFRGRANPLIVALGKGKNVKSYPMPDETIYQAARVQNFLKTESDKIVDKFSRRFDVVPSPIEAGILINVIGRQSIETWPAPRPPRAGDRVWEIGTPRTVSSEIVRILGEGRAVQTAKGDVFKVDHNFVAIMMPWEPFVPDIEEPILWWDKSR